MKYGQRVMLLNIANHETDDEGSFLKEEAGNYVVLYENMHISLNPNRVIPVDEYWKNKRSDKENKKREPKKMFVSVSSLSGEPHAVIRSKVFPKDQHCPDCFWLEVFLKE